MAKNNVIDHIIFRHLVFVMLVSGVVSGIIPAIVSASDSLIIEIATQNISSNPHATILIYHKFGEDEFPSTNVSLDNFSKQLRFLHENKYLVIPLRELVDRLINKETLPEKCVAITIDDGYQSIYTKAWPLLKSYGYPFTVFLYVNAVNQKYRNFLTWQDIAKMQAAGVDFQDHGYSHFRFGSRSHERTTEKEYRQWIRADLQKGNDILNNHLGYRPRLLALPYGEYNSIIQEEAKKLGFRAVFSQDPGSVSSTIDIFAIPREPILGYEWASIPHFKEVLDRRDLPITDLSPSIVDLGSEIPVQFCATLLTPELYRLETLQIYVSELGWQRGVLEEDRLCLPNNSFLKRRTNRVAIEAKEKRSGKSAMRYWLLIREGGDE